MEIPYFYIHGEKETFLQTESRKAEENLIYVRKGVINLTVHVVSSQRNFIVSVEENDQIEFLSRKIGEEMESFDLFKGVMGLRARNLRLIGSNQVIKNEKDRVHMHFKDGDELLCDLESQDLWLKCKVDYLSTFMRDWTAGFEIRLKQDQSFNELRKIIQKMVINIWNSGLKISNIYSKQITILKLLDIGIKNSLLSTFVVNNNSIRSSEEIPDSDLIRDHMTYESGLKVQCRFITLEEEFNLQHPNYYKLHSKMLGFFGVGIPKKSMNPKKSEDASIGSLFPARSDRSKFLFSGRKPSNNNPLLAELEEDKGGETPSKMTDLGSRSFTNALLFKDGTPSMDSASQFTNIRNILFENVLLSSLISPLPQNMGNQSGEQAKSIQQDMEEVSSSVSYSSHRLQSASFHEIVEVSDQESQHLRFSGQIGITRHTKPMVHRPELRTFKAPSLQKQKSFQFSILSQKKISTQQEKMIQMIKLPPFVLSSREIKNVRVIVRNKKLNIEDFSQSSLQGQLPIPFQDQTTIKIPTERRKKCAILGFVIMIFSIVILVAIIVELK